MAKLTEGQAREILASAETGVALARRFGVSTATVSDVRTGRTWSWLYPDPGPPPNQGRTGIPLP